jgi:hypothetical protein
MNVWKLAFAVLASGLACGLCWFSGAASAGPPKGDQKPAENGTLTVIDHAGKEHKLKTWKFVRGTRRLSWMAPPGAPAKKDKDKDDKGNEVKGPAGPEALEFREEKSTDYQEGIMTFVPLDWIRSIEFDNDKRTVTLSVAGKDKEADPEVLKGSTKYAGFNRLTIEAEVDLGELGVASVKFLGGDNKGIRSLRFSAPKVPPAPAAGRVAKVTFFQDEKDKVVQQVSDLQALYRLGPQSERLLPTLLFKKTVKIDLAKIQKLAQSEGSKGRDFDVTLKDGKTHTLTLLRDTNPLDGKAALLEGLVGRVPAGYKLFPPHTITEVQLETPAEAKDAKNQ